MNLPAWLLEMPVLVLFVGGVSITFALCLDALRRLKASAWQKSALTRKDTIVLGLGVCGIACIIHGFIEPFQLETTYHSAQSSKMRDPKSSIRIVHLTDLHCDGLTRVEDQLPVIIAGLKPDVILFTGDAANNIAGLEVFRDTITKIGTIAPTFASYGNHDSRGGASWDIYGNTGVERLEASARLITVKGTPIWIAGVGVDNDKAIDATLSKAPPDVMTIFLHHYPAFVTAANKHNIDFFFAGHTHGGQIRLPLYGAILTNSTMGKSLEYGLHKVGPTQVLVSRGVGMTGLPVRFLAAPEIAVLDITPGSK